MANKVAVVTNKVDNTARIQAQRLAMRRQLALTNDILSIKKRVQPARVGTIIKKAPQVTPMLPPVKPKPIARTKTVQSPDHKVNELRDMANCKKRPEGRRSGSGASRAFVPWC